VGKIMKKVIHSFILLITCVFYSNISADDSYMKGLIDKYVESGKTAGIALAVVDEDGTRFYNAGKLSQDSIVDIDENTIFEIGSITKVMTTIMLQHMALKGDFDVLDPLEKHLPEGVRVPEYNGNKILLKHLATHSSTLPYMPTNGIMVDMANPFSVYTVEQLYEFLNEYELKRMPGEIYDYSNLGTGIIGHILTLRYNTSYVDLVNDVICRPLGMVDTCIDLTPEQMIRLAKGHVGKNEVANWDLPIIEGAGALRSTTKDLAKFLEANLGLVSSDLYPSMDATHEIISDAEYENLSMGLGWHISTDFENPIIWHNGGTGGYHSFLCFNKAKKQGIVLLSNSSAHIDDLALHLVDERFKIAENNTDIVLDPMILERYVGVYKHLTGLVCVVTREGNQLIGQLVGHPPVNLYPESHTKFFVKEIDAQAVFGFDNNDDVSGMTVYRGHQTFWLRRANQ
jgi:serine-type D-Ala-D-Ala carboxypeptidase/endopeptidase